MSRGAPTAAAAGLVLSVARLIDDDGQNQEIIDSQTATAWVARQVALSCG